MNARKCTSESDKRELALAFVSVWKKNQILFDSIAEFELPNAPAFHVPNVETAGAKTVVRFWRPLKGKANSWGEYHYIFADDNGCEGVMRQDCFEVDQERHTVPDRWKCAAAHRNLYSEIACHKCQLPNLNRAERVCCNIGCGKTFLPAENTETSCHFHQAQWCPMYRCCSTPEGCLVGPHKESKDMFGLGL